ncbi:hypothetical protein Salat_2709100 [Sesamum alatum]|uniref:Uncharacterized protein n=1 Tax=Sesamum alatum TaxID=300844 RepID=A0AAE1XQ59_9LAMI|nr:hypothetical protein Salat_2709100 [Sesamum alatum]
MGRIRGFLLKHRVSLFLRRVFRRRLALASYRRVNPPQTNRVKPLSVLISWTRRLRTKAKAIVANNHDTGRGYIRVGQEPVIEQPVPVPKGYMGVYVGQKDDPDQGGSVYPEVAEVDPTRIGA